jgi:chorismate mutase
VRAHGESVPPSLAELRASIDALDEAIVLALGKSFALALIAGENKRVAIRDEVRETEVLAHVEQLATAHGGNAAAICSIYRLILNVSVETQEEQLGRRPAHGDAHAEREFWSTFGEDGIRVFWSLSADAVDRLDAPTRGRLVALTNAVAFGEPTERASLLATISELPEDERVDALCRLAGGDDV